MSIRLSKAIKELNIGLSTAVDFLGKKGHEVESNPNTKLTDDEYLLLANEFNKDMAVKLESEKLIQKRQTKEKNESKALDGFLKRNPEKKEKIFKTKTADEMPHIKTVGHIDINNPKLSSSEKKTNKKESIVEKTTAEISKKTEVKIEEPKTEKTITTSIIENVSKEEVIENKQIVETQPIDTKNSNKEKNGSNKEEKNISQKEKAPEQESVKEDKTVAKAEPKQKDNKSEITYINISSKEQSKATIDNTEENPITEEEEFFRFNEPVKLSGPVVTGTIDLDKINTSTRPKPSRNKKDKRKKGGNDKDDVDEITNKTTKRKRINKKLVDVGKSTQSNNKKSGKKERNKKPIKTEVDQEEVQKQIKETLARLSRSNKKRGKGAKYRQERREQANARLHEQEERERSEEKILKLTEFVTVNELATMMDVSVNEVIGTCMSIGMMVSINQRLDAETINIVADEFGFSTEYVSDEVVGALLDSEEPDREEDLEPRAPIVTVMGHVDHGKTSLLDYIRDTNVIAGEAGGITQHIGAYNVKLSSGQRITFLDTPGHEAFTAMRARGAKITDIAIIIVAADDDVMPQTKEAINHAAAAGVPIVFAINKIDKPGANPDKIKETLANMNYLVEDWGGKYQSQDISAKKGQGIEELLEKVLLEAELLDLKANPKRRAIGSIIESSLDKGRGYVTTLLVQNGSLRVGDNLIAGTYHGKIKAMFNERNQQIEEARPAEPVLILGMNGAPQAGDTFNEVETEQEAKEIAHKREQLQREQSLRTKKHFTLDELGRRIALGDFQELNIIVKGDVDGSIEALADTLIKLSTEHIQINVIHKAVGAISDSDVLLAAASNAIIVGFQVRPTVSARKMAEKEEIDIRLYSIIYDAVEELKSAMEGMLAPIMKEEITATVEVLEVFKITKVGTVAGCLVKEGKVGRNNKLRIIRDGIVVYTGEIAALKRHKDDVKEVGTNFECGISVKNYNDIKVGDLFETFESIEVKQTL